MELQAKRSKIVCKMSKNTCYGARRNFSGGRRRKGPRAQVSGCLWAPQAHMARPWGWAPPRLVASRCTPPGVCSVPKILKYQKKFMLNFQAVLRTFIFALFYCEKKSGKQTKQDILGNLNFIETKPNRG